MTEYMAADEYSRSQADAVPNRASTAKETQSNGNVLTKTDERISKSNTVGKCTEVSCDATDVGRHQLQADAQKVHVQQLLESAHEYWLRCTHARTRSIARSQP